MGKGRLLFDGEFVIVKKGVYTFIHFYRHPQTGVRVVLCGMNHFGERDYFAKIRKILSRCDIVIFEGVRPRYWKNYLKLWEKIGKIVEKQVLSGDQRLIAYGKEFWKKFMKRIKFVKERKALRENKRNWICGDESFWLTLFQRENYTRFAFREVVWHSRLSENYKKSLRRFYQTKLAALRKNRWRKKDLGEYYCAVIDNPVFYRYLDITLGYERERITMEVFDRILREKKPKRIAIKFGAAHIARFRKHLERRGFRRYKVRRLRNIAFPV